MSDLVARFKASAVIDQEMWHDGIGYDVSLLATMSETEKSEVESFMISRGVNDWRDLEALHHLNTPEAISAILETRKSPIPDLQLHAQRYGPAPDGEELEATILAGLNPNNVNSKSIDEAAENPSPKIIQALLKCAKECEGTDAYQAVNALYFIHGKTDSMHSFAHRKFFLRFVDGPSPDQAEAFDELCRKLKIQLEPA